MATTSYTIEDLKDKITALRKDALLSHAREMGPDTNIDWKSASIVVGPRGASVVIEGVCLTCKRDGRGRWANISFAEAI